MVTYQCPTCQNEYPVEIMIGSDIYMKDNLRIKLMSENQDCVDCEKEIQLESERIIEQARDRVRAKKLGTNEENV